MFGLPSPSKLIVLVVVVLAVWHGFKWINRLDKSRKASAPQPRRKGRGRADRDNEPAREEARGIETTTCPTCGTYFPASAGRYCGGNHCKA